MEKVEGEGKHEAEEMKKKVNDGGELNRNQGVGSLKTAKERAKRKRKRQKLG